MKISQFLIAVIVLQLSALLTMVQSDCAFNCDDCVTRYYTSRCWAGSDTREGYCGGDKYKFEVDGVWSKCHCCPKTMSEFLSEDIAFARKHADVCRRFCGPI